MNIDGTIDNSFSIGTGFQGNDISSATSPVNRILIQKDGKILIGGAFSIYNGTIVNGFIRLNSDGTIDNTFYAGAVGRNNTPTINAIL